MGFQLAIVVCPMLFEFAGNFLAEDHEQVLLDLR
jgi:hypothetical protein